MPNPGNITANFSRISLHDLAVRSIDRIQLSAFPISFLLVLSAFFFLLFFLTRIFLKLGRALKTIPIRYFPSIICQVIGKVTVKMLNVFALSAITMNTFAADYQENST